MTTHQLTPDEAARRFELSAATVKKFDFDGVDGLLSLSVRDGVALMVLGVFAAFESAAELRARLEVFRCAFRDLDAARASGRPEARLFYVVDDDARTANYAILDPGVEPERGPLRTVFRLDELEPFVAAVLAEK